LRLFPLLLLLAVATPALAQPRREAPPPPPDQITDPDPMGWWTDDWPAKPEAFDPLRDRRLGRGDRLTPVDNGVEPSLYRVWKLPPLQTQVLHEGEMILEVWARPARSVRQTVIRIIVRRGGEVFVQARVGLGCCEPGISRLVETNQQLPPGSADRFLALRGHPMWSAPVDVTVEEGGGAVSALCVEGVAYDVTLVVPGRARHLRRACDNAEIGQIADALEPAFAAALGHEPRIDVLYPRGGDFTAARSAYAGLLAEGGRLKPEPRAQAQPSAVETPPAEDAAANAPAP
jgi:hypothetical protein